MQTLNVLALFCEDIREEKDDIVTLIGIMPDIVNLEVGNVRPDSGGTKRMLSKLAIYTRINFDPDLDVGLPEATLIVTNQEPIKLGNVDDNLVNKAKSEAKAKGALLAGIVVRATIWRFSPPENDSIRVEIDIKGQKYLAGALRFQSVSL